MTVQKNLEKFCFLMNKKASELGMTDSVFNDPAGCDNYSTVKDILNCLIEAVNTETIYNIFSNPKDTIDIKGPNEREMSFESKTIAGESSKALRDYYKVIGGKGGTLLTPKIYNVAVLAENSDGVKLGCVIMNANEHNDGVENRFKAARQALDIATKKENVSDVCAKSAIVCVIPENKQDKLTVLYEKNPCEVIKPASMSKMLTAILVLENIKDIYEEVCVKQEVLNLIPGKFYQNDFKDGDIVSVRDLLSAMFLPSSNAAAFILGCIVGEKIK